MLRRCVASIACSDSASSESSPQPEAAGTTLPYVDDTSDEAGGSFRQALAEVAPTFAALRLTATADAADVEHALLQLAAARARGGATVLAWRSRKSAPRAALRPLLDGLGERGVVVVFGNPYLAGLLPPTSAVLCAYGTSPSTASTAARVLCGQSAAFGRLPVSVPGVAAGGD